MPGPIYTNQNDFPSGKSTLAIQITSRIYSEKTHLYIVKPSVQIKLNIGQNTNYVNGRPSVPSGLPGNLFWKTNFLNP